MKHKWLIALGIVVAVAAAVVVWGLNNKNTAIRYASIGINWFRYLNAPAGTIQTFTAPGAQPAAKPPVNLAAYAGVLDTSWVCGFGRSVVQRLGSWWTECFGGNGLCD